jgi:hypothetical protein
MRGACVPQRDIPRFIAMYSAGLLPVDLLRTSAIVLEEVNAGFDLLDRGEVAQPGVGLSTMRKIRSRMRACARPERSATCRSALLPMRSPRPPSRRSIVR